jgi:hypothetical protein
VNYGNTTKLLNRADVRTLANRKAAILEGIEEARADFLEKGKELFEKATAKSKAAKEA